MVNTITERQVAFLNNLQAERDTTDAEPFLEVLRQHYREGRATAREASAVIEGLLGAPRKANGSLSPGIYECEHGALYRVYLGQNSGLMLAKQIVQVSGDVDYVYAGRADNLDRPRRLTREEVAERTLSYGSTSCMVCGRRLDDPESVDRGVGPVCWENYA